jgi:hypothetical protein
VPYKKGVQIKDTVFESIKCKTIKWLLRRLECEKIKTRTDIKEEHLQRKAEIRLCHNMTQPEGNVNGWCKVAGTWSRQTHYSLDKVSLYYFVFVEINFSYVLHNMDKRAVLNKVKQKDAYAYEEWITLHPASRILQIYFYSCEEFPKFSAVSLIFWEKRNMKVRTGNEIIEETKWEK